MSGDITSDLIGHWTLNGDLTAEVGPDQTPAVGTVTFAEDSGPPWPQVGVFSNDGIATATSFPGIDVGSPISYSAWIKKPAGPTGYIFTTRDGAANTGAMSYLVQSDGTVDVLGNGTVLSTSDTVDDGSWHHIVATYDGGADGSATYKLYIDGSLSGTETNESASFDIAGEARIGHRGDGAGGGGVFFEGSISDVRIYNRELSDIDVTALFEYDPFAFTATSVVNYEGFKIPVGSDSFSTIARTEGESYESIHMGSLQWAISVDDNGDGSLVTIDEVDAEETNECTVGGAPIYSGRIGDNWFVINRPDGEADADVEFFYKGNLFTAKRFGTKTYL